MRNRGSALLATTSTWIGLVSCGLAIYEFFQQKGLTADRIGNARYHLGFIAFMGLILVGILVGGVVALLQKYAVISDAWLDKHAWPLNVVILAAAAVVGFFIGRPMAESNLRLLAMSPIERMNQPQPVPILWMQVVGVAALFIPIVLWIAYAQEKRASKSSDADASLGHP